MKPFELFVFFVLPFIAAAVCRWIYLHAPRLLRHVFFGGLAALALWIWWESPNQAVRSGVLAMYAIVGIPTLLIAWIWPWLVRLAVFPYKMAKRLSTSAANRSGVDSENRDKVL